MQIPIFIQKIKVKLCRKPTFQEGMRNFEKDCLEIKCKCSTCWVDFELCEGGECCDG